jgi:hypothetical protein
MTMTTTTTIPQVPIVRSRTRALWLAAVFAVGGALGAGLTALVTDDGATSPTPVATAPSPAANAASLGVPHSADAAERQALADQAARRELCTSSLVSADSVEHCVASG